MVARAGKNPKEGNRMSDRLSNCCGAPVWAGGEIDEHGFGICADCKEHSFFPPSCPECDSADVVWGGHCWVCEDCKHAFRAK